jgi:hypothetical protein
MIPSENISSGQSSISGKPPAPGAIPARSPSMSELVELKLLCRDTRHALEGVYAAIATLDLGDGFENAAEVMDDAGKLVESISQFSQRALKRMDERKAGRSS